MLLCLPHGALDVFLSSATLARPRAPCLPGLPLPFFSSPSFGALSRKGRRGSFSSQPDQNQNQNQNHLAAVTDRPSRACQHCFHQLPPPHVIGRSKL